MFRTGNKLLFLSIAGMVLFYLIFSIYSDSSQVFKSLTSMKIVYMPLILSSIFIGVFFKSVRQYYLLRANNVNIPFKVNMIIFMAGMSLVFTPGGLGQVIKSKFLKDGHEVAIKNTVPVVMMENYHEFLAYVIIIAFTLLFYNFLIPQIAILFGSIILIVIYINVRYEKTMQFLRKYLMKIKFLRKKLEGEEGFRNTFYKLTSPKNMLLGSTITLCSVFFELLGIYFIFLSFNFNLNFILISQISLESLLLGYVSFLPNGIGVTDGSFIGLLIKNNIPLALATTVVMTIRFTGLWFKTLIGVIALKFLKMKDATNN